MQLLAKDAQARATTLLPLPQQARRQSRYLQLRGAFQQLAQHLRRHPVDIQVQPAQLWQVRQDAIRVCSGQRQGSVACQRQLSQAGGGSECWWHPAQVIAGQVERCKVWIHGQSGHWWRLSNQGYRWNAARTANGAVNCPTGAPIRHAAALHTTTACPRALRARSTHCAGKGRAAARSGRCASGTAAAGPCGWSVRVTLGSL